MIGKKYRGFYQDGGLVAIRSPNGEAIKFSQILDVLNEQHEENQQLKTTIIEAYNNERTEIGKSVLKQLIEQME